MLVKLKKVTDHDTGLIVKWRNENKEFFGSKEDINIVGHLQWFYSTYLYDPFDHYYMVMAVGQPVGTISMNTAVHEVGRVLLGVKGSARQGIMSEALELLLAAHYNPWYTLNVWETNDSAIAFYRKHYFEISRYYNPPPGMVTMERIDP